MNSLPSELVSRIVEYAAACDCTQASYKGRQKTLASLTLVNRTLHEMAQPLLPQILMVDSATKLVPAFDENTALSDRVLSVLDTAQCPGSPPNSLKNSFPFRFLRELRLGEIPLGSIDFLHGHQHLKRLMFGVCDFVVAPSYSEFILPHLEELSLDNTLVYCDPGVSQDVFLAASHYPKLQALSLRACFCFAADGGDPIEIPQRLLSQLHCVSIDDNASLPSRRPSSSRSAFPLPVLFDVDPSSTKQSWGNSSSSPQVALSQTHIRIRLHPEPIPHRREIEAALFLAESIIRDTPDLKQLYLDLYPRDRRRGYVLDDELEERIRVLEDPRRKKKVEIIWENHGDDMLKSLVSREFWKVCRREKEKRESEM